MPKRFPMLQVKLKNVDFGQIAGGSDDGRLGVTIKVHGRPTLFIGLKDARKLRRWLDNHNLSDKGEWE